MNSDEEPSGAATLGELLTNIEASFTENASESDLISDFQSICRQISTTPDLSSSAIPYRALREFIQRTLANQSLSAAALLEASCTFLQLVRVTPLAYEELIMTTCFQKVVHIVKDAVPKCSAGCDTNRFLCDSSAHIPVDKYSKFWLNLTSLIDSTSFDIQAPGFLQIAVNALADLIGHSKGAWHQTLAVQGFTSILERVDIRGHSPIYRALFPLFRRALPAANRNTLVKILETAGERELSEPFPPSTTGSDRQHHTTDSEDSNEDQDEQVNKPAAKNDNPRIPLLRFLELCCVHVLDRAEQRLWLSTMLVRVFASLHEVHHQSFKSFLLRTSEHPKARVRLFTVEVSPKFVFMSPMPNCEMDSNFLPWIQMLAIRSNDRVPSIRAKALTSMTELFKSMGESALDGDMLNKLLSIAFSLRRRLSDPKARVRKSAVDFIGLSARLLLAKTGDLLEDDEIGSDTGSTTSLASRSAGKVLKLYSLFKDRCDDAVSNVRIASISQATQIILNFPSGSSDGFRGRLMTLWCKAVPQHINDTDNRSREACLKAVQAVFDPKENRPGRPASDSHLVASPCSYQKLPGLILETLANGDRTAAELLKNSLSLLCRSGSLDTRSIRHLCEKAGLASDNSGCLSEVQKGSWIALAEVSACGKVDAVKEYVKFELLMRHAVVFKNSSACKVAKALANGVPPNAAETWCNSLAEEVFGSSSFQNGVTREWIPSAISLLASLQSNRGNSILEQCNSRIMKSEEISSEEVEHLLIVIGSVCLSFQLQTQLPESLLTFVCALTSNNTKHPELRALALTTLGKICLCHGAKQAVGTTGNGNEKSHRLNKLGESMTRRNISIFVHELDNPTSSASRNNAVLILCDLCRLYTAVVEPYIARMASLLSDSSDFVRTQVLSSLVVLLQEDYIKVRGGHVLYHIADCLLDTCGSVRSTAEYCLLHVVSQKNCSVLATSFIELMFVLNNCTECHIYNHNRTSPRKSRFHSIEEQDFEQRLKIYDVFLRGMTLEQKLRLPSRFRTDIIGLIVDEKLDISKASVQAVLSDTLQLLCNDRLRSLTAPKVLQDSTNTATQEEDMSQRDELGVGNVQLNKKMSLLSKIQMLELRETTVPALLEIRHRLEQMRSPLLRTLMRCFCTLLQPHRKDLENIIRDAVVRSEILHEMGGQTKEVKGTENVDERGDHRKTEKAGLKRGQDDRSPSDVKLMSVPRTRKVRKVRKLDLCGSDSEDEGIMESEGGSEGLMQRIAASPKLATIAGRTRRAKTFDVDARNNPSDFAKALARIEDEAVRP